MKKKERSVNIPTIEEVENEQKRLRHRAVYQRTLRGTIAVLLVVAAISVLVATLWMPVLQIYGSSMSPTLEAGQIVVSVKTNTGRQQIHTRKKKVDLCRIKERIISEDY